MEIDLAALVLRWMHILAAITAVGGVIFSRVALVPAKATLGDRERAQLDEALRARWLVPVMVSIAFLLASGLYNIAQTAMTYQVPSWYHMLFGIKFLLAMIVFFIASTLVGRSVNAERFRQHGKFWLNVNLALAVAVVLISGILRAAPRELKPTKIEPPATVTPAEVAK